MLLVGSCDVVVEVISFFRGEDHWIGRLDDEPPGGVAPRRAARRLAGQSAPAPQGHMRHRSLGRRPFPRGRRPFRSVRAQTAGSEFSTAHRARSAVDSRWLVDVAAQHAKRGIASADPVITLRP